MVRRRAVRTISNIELLIPPSLDCGRKSMWTREEHTWRWGRGGGGRCVLESVFPSVGFPCICLTVWNFTFTQQRRLTPVTNCCDLYSSHFTPAVHPLSCFHACLVWRGPNKPRSLRRCILDHLEGEKPGWRWTNTRQLLKDGPMLSYPGEVNIKCVCKLCRKTKQTTCKLHT